jgi:steroid 5-alpha reductase family enzyme
MSSSSAAVSYAGSFDVFNVFHLKRLQWSVSRHPNYLGEIIVWCASLATCLRAELTEMQAIWFLSGRYSADSRVMPEFLSWLGALSPLFVYFLLARVSGIPLLEAASEAKYGSNPEWRAYRARVSRF